MHGRRISRLDAPLATRINDVPGRILSLTGVSPNLFFDDLYRPTVNHFIDKAGLVFAPSNVRASGQRVNASEFSVVIFSRAKRACGRYCLAFGVVIKGVVSVKSKYVGMIGANYTVNGFPYLSPALLLPARRLGGFNDLRRRFFIYASASTGVNGDRLFRRQNIRPRQDLADALWEVFTFRRPGERAVVTCR